MKYEFRPRLDSRFAAGVRPNGVQYWRYALGAFGRILPHTQTRNWRILEEHGRTRAAFADETRRILNLEVAFVFEGRKWRITGELVRRTTGAGVGNIARTISPREKDIARRVLESAEELFVALRADSADKLAQFLPAFDEQVVAAHLVGEFRLRVDLSNWFAVLRRLAEQSYENKSLVFGCIIDSRDDTFPSSNLRFPSDFLIRKKFRSLSDGYKTVYVASRRGALIGFARVGQAQRSRSGKYPEWCNEIASDCSRGRFGIVLTRQGDMLIFDHGQLSFSYRRGQWQFWNHSHIVDLMKNAARAQNVKEKKLGDIVSTLYKAILDVSFKRTGGLFVLLRNRTNIDEIVRTGDAIGDSGREAAENHFDGAFEDSAITSIPRAVIAEIAALDGAVVINNSGTVSAYGAVLEPSIRKGILRAEGSRTKAAIGASHFGLALKISSDGDVSVFMRGEKLIEF